MTARPDEPVVIDDPAATDDAWREAGYALLSATARRMTRLEFERDAAQADLARLRGALQTWRAGLQSQARNYPNERITALDVIDGIDRILDPAPSPGESPADEC